MIIETIWGSIIRPPVTAIIHPAEGPLSKTVNPCQPAGGCSVAYSDLWPPCGRGEEKRGISPSSITRPKKEEPKATGKTKNEDERGIYCNLKGGETAVNSSGQKPQGFYFDFCSITVAAFLWTFSVVVVFSSVKHWLLRLLEDKFWMETSTRQILVNFVLLILPPTLTGNHSLVRAKQAAEFWS